MERAFWGQRVYLAAIAMLILPTLWMSCSQPYTMAQVVVGNYRYEQGNYSEATHYYFKALQQEYQEDMIYFNLGSLYHALGEAKAAQEMWQHITDDSSFLLRSQAYYNQGVVYYQLGQYALAILAFRNALILNSQDINAKINLELAQIALQRQNERGNHDNTTAIPESSQRQLDYLKRRNTIFLGIEAQENAWNNPDDL